MKIRVLSDLHVDIRYNEWTPEPVDCDLVVVAGDVREGVAHSLRWLRQVLPDDRIVFVAGNHEYYVQPGTPADVALTLERQRIDARQVAHDCGIVWLDDHAVELDGVRFIGSTLWSDFTQRADWMPIDVAARTAQRDHNDYRLIRTGRGRGRDRLRPSETIASHRTSRAFIERELAVPFDGPTIVVTHHCPLPNVPPEPYDYCYRSDLSHLMHSDAAPDLWIHGHVHRAFDAVVGRTRVVSNPRGYPLFMRPQPPREVAGFDPSFVVEIETPEPTFRL